jgi:hypothetical protein
MIKKFDFKTLLPGSVISQKLFIYLFIHQKVYIKHNKSQMTTKALQKLFKEMILFEVVELVTS